MESYTINLKFNVNNVCVFFKQQSHSFSYLIKSFKSVNFYKKIKFKVTNNKPTGTNPDLERFCFKGGTKKKKKKGNPETNSEN